MTALTAITRTELDFVGTPLLLILFLAAVLCVLLVLGYRRDRGLVPGWVGRLLTVLRVAAVLLLLALFLEVVLRRVREEVQQGEVLLAYDASRSMALRDELRPAWQKAREAVALGALDPALRETSAERARAALPDLARAEIPPAGWEALRRWAVVHGVAAGDIDAAQREVRARLDAALSATAGASAQGTPEAAQPAREALAAALESLQRLLDGALLRSGGEGAEKAARRLEPLSRLALAREVLERAAPGAPLAALGARFRISTVAIDGASAGTARVLDPAPAAGSGPPSVAPPRPPPPGEIVPDGPWTDLGQPLLDEAARRSRETLAAVVLVSDGRHNRGQRPEEVLKSLGAMGVPLFTLGVGSERPPRDVRIADIDAASKVFSGDEIKADLAIETVAMGALSFPIRISDGDKTVKEVTAEIPAGAELTHVPLTFPAPSGGASGRKKYSVSFPLQPGETTDANNSRDFWVSILSEKVRVLLLDGGPRWEYRYLKNALERDPNVKVDAFLVTRPPDRRLPAGFPREREALFAYDVVVIGDVEASVFTAEELAAIHDLVAARGASLVLIAGERAMPYDYGETPLADLLPVRLLRARPPAGEGAVLGRAGFRPRLTPDGEASPITRLVPGREANRELWKALPPMEWLAPVAAARPGAAVLATLPGDAAARLAGGEEGAAAPGTEPAPAAGTASEGGAPLLATLAFGAGRTFYSGVDSTWKWRYLVGDQLFARFWGQVVRWAASERIPPGDDLVRLGTDEIRYQSPAKVTIRAIATDPGGKPLEGALIDAIVRHVRSGAVRRVRLQPVPQSGGLYRATLEIESGPGGAGLGEHEVRLDIPTLPGYSARADRAVAGFLVEEPPSREAGDLTRDPALLAEMARRAGPGGRYLPLDRAAELAALVPEHATPRAHTSTTDQWVLSWPVLLLFAALVAVEWIVRKRFDLM